MSGESAVSRMTVVDMPWLQPAEVCCLHAGFCIASPGNILQETLNKSSPRHRPGYGLRRYDVSGLVQRYLYISLSLIRPSTRGREARSFTKEMC